MREFLTEFFYIREYNEQITLKGKNVSHHLSIYLDESGDLGFNFNDKKPCPHFVITLLICKDHYTNLKFKSAVKHTLAHKLNQKNKRKRVIQELKSTQTTFEVKKYFLNNLNNNQLNWNLHTIILDKKKLITNTQIAPNPHRIYNILSHRVLEKVDFDVKSNIQLHVDLCKSPNERKIFDQYLLTNLEAQLPLNFTLNIAHQHSHANPGLQAVDIFSWGILRKYVSEDMSWYNLFKERIVSEEVYEG